jgi:hypothetical protein
MTIYFYLINQVMWTFSIYLEAVAILPQLVLLQRTRNIDNLTGQYVFFLGYDLIFGAIFFCPNTVHDSVLMFSSAGKRLPCYMSEDATVIVVATRWLFHEGYFYLSLLLL